MPDETCACCGVPIELCAGCPTCADPLPENQQEPAWSWRDGFDKEAYEASRKG